MCLFQIIILKNAYGQHGTIYSAIIDWMIANAYEAIIAAIRRCRVTCEDRDGWTITRYLKSVKLVLQADIRFFKLIKVR